MKVIHKFLDWTGGKKKIKNFLSGLDREVAPFSAYDEDDDTIVVALGKDYKISKQCPGSRLTLLEENHENAGLMPIVGFQIKDVRKICWRHGISMEALRVTQVLAAIGYSSCGFCIEMAVEMATKFVDEYNLDEIEF